MRALTLHQPWAWAVCCAGKRIENRVWAPPGWLVGQDFAIHAGTAYDRPGRWRIERELIGRKIPTGLPCGAVVAVVRLSSVLKEAPPPGSWQRAWWSGPVGWLLEDVRVLAEPVPARGWQRLWNLPSGVERRVRVQLAGGA